jgi:hypothetical protein
MKSYTFHMVEESFNPDTYLPSQLNAPTSSSAIVAGSQETVRHRVSCV